jgi:hypothetical protein
VPANELNTWIDPLTPLAGGFGNPDFSCWENGAPFVDAYDFTGTRIISGAGALSGQAALTGAGIVFKIGAGAFSGQAVLIGTGAIVVPGVVNGAGSLSGFAVLSGAATIKPPFVPPIVPSFEQIQGAVSLLSDGLSFSLLLDVLRFRRVKLDYISPAICEVALQSGSSSGLMIFMESD